MDEIMAAGIAGEHPGSMAGVPLALARPEPSSAVTAWTPQPLAIALATLLVVGYLVGLRRLHSRWPARRIAVFALGILVLAWTTCGFLEVYADSLFWAWTAQTLLLWLVVPIVVLAGHPVQLARAAGGPGGRVDRVLRSRFSRIVGNPLISPALVPLLSFVLFFGPVPGWAIEWAPLGWAIHIGLLAVGALLAVPLIGLDENATSLAVGLSMAIGTFELVLDAAPGMMLRLHHGLLATWFDHRTRRPWSPDALHDQRVAGATLWCVAQLLALPFVWLVFRRWVRADARDAAAADAVLEAERVARRALPGPGVEPGRDAPWWLTDPALRERLHRRE
jgi:putative copper resistance protein D